MLQGREQERPESSLARIDGSEKILCQKPREKFLRQVLSVVRAFTLPSDVSIKRRPINPAKLLKGLLRCLGILSARRRQNHAPLRLREPLRMGQTAAAVWVGTGRKHVS